MNAKTLIAAFGFSFLFVFVFQFFNIRGYLEKPQTAVDKIPQLLNISEVVTIAAAGDVACSFTSGSPEECAQSKTAKLIEDLNPDLVLALGDLQYPKGTLKDFQNFYDKSWGKFKDKTKPVPGNHEYETPFASGFYDYFAGLEKGKGYYSFDKGNWHFIALNSNCWAVGGCEKNSIQAKWLVEDLKNNTSKCTLAFFHHPLFSSEKRGGNEFVKYIWQVLYDNNVDVVLNGHNHAYERYSPQTHQGVKDETSGIRQFTVGTGGRSLYAFATDNENIESKTDKDFGVLKLTLKEDSYDWDFLPVTEGFSDKGSADCH